MVPSRVGEFRELGEGTSDSPGPVVLEKPIHETCCVYVGRRSAFHQTKAYCHFIYPALKHLNKPVKSHQIGWHE